VLTFFSSTRQQIDMNSTPFDYDPLSLDFPALTLQCLQPPPTLFSSMPHPTSTSWSIQPPAQNQYDALVAYFEEEFKAWRITCTTATTAAQEDLTYPPSQTHSPVDVRENIKKAEKAAANLEKQVTEHLQSAFGMWEQVTPERKQELWILELARGVGRRQKDNEKLKQAQHALKQENSNLQTQIEQLNRLQQPREFRQMLPATIPFDQAFVSHVLAMGVETNMRGIGMNMDDRHVDLTTLVQRAIERWKSVIVSNRATGMNAQRPLDQTPSASVAPGSTMANVSSTPTPIVPTQPRQATQQTQARQVTGTATAAAAATAVVTTPNGPSAESRSTTAAPSASTANEEGSDEDADAEMEDDDSFAPVSAPVVVKPQSQEQPLQKLQIPRARDSQNAQRNNAQFAMNGHMVGNQRVNMARPMANMNPAAMQQAQNQRAQAAAAMKTNDYGTPVQGISTTGDPMYMD
jgi:hypothetical protein